MGNQRVLLRLFSILLTFALIAAACGGDDDGDGGSSASGGDGGSETTAAPPTTAAEQAAEVEEKVEEGDATGQDVREVDTGPVHGGKLVYGVEADSANPFAHYAVSCAISCYVILRTVSDTLLAVDKDTNVQPNTASVTHSDDYMTWTLTPRKGITFHDGEPFDAAAVKYNIDTCRASALTGAYISNIVNTEVVGDDLVYTMGTPWSRFDLTLSGGQCMYTMSPKWLRSLPDNPLRNPDSPFFDQETADTPPDGDPSKPVGLGAFTFESFTPGNGNSYMGVRNEDYWRGSGPDATGEDLPYLDEVEVVVAVDIASRTAGLESGQFDIIHTSNSDEIKRFRDKRDEFTLLEANDFGETNYILINHGAGTNESLGGVAMDEAGSNAGSPLLFKSCRRALAHATDNERIAEERGAGIVRPANGPFPPGSVGYLEDTGYPQYDLDAAAGEMETCLADVGSDKIEFTYNTTNDPFNVQTNELIVSMWKEAFGDQVDATIQPIEQGQYIGIALTGAFQAQGWRQHGGVDPDSQLLWWIPQTASPIGQLALNFGRFQDPVIAENMFAIRTTADPAARQAAAENVNRQFGEQAYYLWNTWTLWGVMANQRLQNLTDLPIYETDTSVIPIVSGGHATNQIWCLDGDCQG